MNEIQAIIELADAAGYGSTLAMATVIKVQGSTYRRPGARMLLTNTGNTAGVISGGCLDGDVRERARKVMETQTAQVVTYDSTAPEDIVFGLGLGCNGIVDVLIEPQSVREQDGILALFKSCLENHQPCKIATAFPIDRPRTGIVPVSRLMKWPDGTVTTNGPDSYLAAALVQELECAPGSRWMVRPTDIANLGRYEVLVETISPPVSLTVFGAGDDAIPVTRFAKLLGWHVTVIDVRPTYAQPERFPAVDAVICLNADSLADCPELAVSPFSLAIVMTHNYTHDREILRRILPLHLRYVGVLGPQSRTRRLLDDLAADGPPIHTDTLKRLHGPAGLDIGAETPEEIALSLLAEMQATLTRHRGGPLRELTVGIHDNADPQP